MPSIVCTLLNLYLILIFVRIIASWFPISPGTPMASAFSVLYSITEPVLGPIRRVMPSIGGGGMQLDLSPIVVIIVIRIICR